MRRTGLLAVICSLALGCAGGGVIAVRPTETVRVLGASADAVGRTVERDERDGFVRVELHEGPSVWVEPGRVRAAELEEGTSVVVADAAGTLLAASVAEDLDRVIVVVGADGARHLVPLERVLAILHAPIASATAADEVTPPPPPPPDPRRFATRPTTTELFERVRVASCSAAGARLLADDGSIVTVPARDLRPLRVQPGERVHALWQNGDTAYAALVLALEGRLVSVRYDDGSEEWVRMEQIVRRESTGGGGSSSGGAAGCPRGGAGFAMIRRGSIRRVVEVVSCGEASAVVRAPAEEASAEIALADLRALAVPEGVRIEVLWQQSAPYVGWAGATHDGNVEVRYEDGSVAPAPITDVRWIATDVLAEPFVCPAE